MQSTKKWRLAQKLELLWWKRYLNKKSPAEYLVWKQNYWRDFLVKIGMPSLSFKNQEILDAGCGPAGINMVLENNNVTAFDPLIDDYKTLLHFQSQQFPFVNYHKNTLESFKSDKQFDTIFCLNAINHVSDIDKSYQILANNLKSGGKIIISIDAHNHAFFKHLFRLVPGDALHPHQYDLQEYRDFVLNCGLKIESEHRLDKGFFFDYWAMVVSKN